MFIAIEFSAAALFFCCYGLEAWTPIVRSVSVDYLKPAKTDLIADLTLTEEEAAEKIAAADFEMSWELIGHLQSNKAGTAVKIFDRIQSVDTIEILDKIDARAALLGKVQRVLLQVNSGADPAKFGADMEDAPRLLERALGLKNILVEGLMAIAPLDPTLKSAKICFDNLYNLRESLQEKFSHPLPELSMGMSDDLELAVEAGSTMIRVGTFLFGEREK